jgi:cytochrome c oxidase accessory protein FixG
MYWLVGLTFSTYLFAGFTREKMCTYMCPYGRFQSAMLDKDSFVVTYHGWRGEPRGKSKTQSGDCIDCGKCVHVCPMGIDIRDGLQLKCIGCGLCVDACESVMEKLERPLGLISYDSINSTRAKVKGKKFKRHIFKFKTFLFLAIFSIVSTITLFALYNKPRLAFNVIRDRDNLVTMLPDGSLRNNYQIKIFNKQSLQKHLKLYLEGHNDLHFKVQNQQSEFVSDYEFVLEPEEELDLELLIKLPAESIINNNINFNIIILDENSGDKVSSETTFIVK